jgi:hypothetical protein
MRHFAHYLLPIIALVFAFAVVAPVLAHQPFFEEADIQPDAPWKIDDPTISTALYATLESPTDVDYFAFEGMTGQSILLEITIPQIEGQEEFAPTMALFGPGLPTDPSVTDILPQVARPDDAKALLLPAVPGPAHEFFEPFSRTAYWERQGERVTLPSDGHYIVAVWHDAGQIGRYVFVIGDKERLGGDPAFPIKMEKYWTPVPTTDGSSASNSEQVSIIGLLLQLLRDALGIE